MVIPLETLPEYTQMEAGVYATDIRAMVPVDMDADGDLDLVVADGNTGYTCLLYTSDAADE